MSLVRADSAEGGSLELAPRVDDAIVVEDKQEEEQERELDEHEVALRQEYHEQMSAQIAALAVDIPHVSIMDGIESAIMFRRAHRKTKAEWNAERVRDFRVCKDGSDDKAKAAEEELENEIEAELAATAGADTASSFRVDADPDPFIRDYQFSSYKQSLRHLKAKNAPFSIRVLDLCGQLIGDNKLADVAYSLRRCPLHVLNLSDNNLTDQGMALLADVLRSLGQLDDLLLSHNDITDEGVEKIFGARVYPPHLRKVDLSFNALGPKAAFTLGRMFQGDRTCRLSALYLGGKKNKKGLGDDFIRILVDFLTRPNARALRRLSVPNAGLAHDGVSAIAAYVTCAQEMEYLNITQNSLMDPVCRRFLRDALRNNKTMKEFACGSGGISRVEKMELQFAFSSQFTLTWNEKMSLAYQTAKELNKCHHMGHAIELVVTNNWQAAKPTPWHEFEPGDPSKVVNKPPRAAATAAAADVAKAPPALADGHGETAAAAGEGEGGGIAPPESSVVTKESAVPAREAAPPIAVVGKSELLNIPFAILTMNMELSQHAKSALLSIDEVNTYVVRLTGQFEECEAWLEDNVAGFKPPSEMRQKKKKMILREDTVGKRKEDLLVMLEKFTSVAIVKTVQEGNKKKGKKKKSKKKKGDVQSWKKGAKGQRITLESVLLTIEQLRSSFIELADALQYLIGVGYLLRIRHLDAARKKRKADQVSAFTSKKEALAFAQNKNKKVDEPFGSEASIPYLKTLGIAGTYTFSLHVGAPAEEERRKRSVLAFEADRRRQESAAHKEALKNKKTRKLLGPRFQIFARGTFPTPRDEEGDDPYVVDAGGGGEGGGGGGGGDGDEFPLEGVKDDKAEEAEKEESSEEESSDEEEEEEKEEEEGKNGKGERERTRFTVPKREMQRKYESLVIEDLAANKAGIKDLVSQLSRGNRRHIVRTLELPLAMPADRPGDPTVDVSVYIEVEEERSEPMESLRRLDSIKPRIAFEERVRARRSAHKYIREELASAV